MTSTKKLLAEGMKLFGETEANDLLPEKFAYIRRLLDHRTRSTEHLPLRRALMDSRHLPDDLLFVHLMDVADRVCADTPQINADSINELRGEDPLALAAIILIGMSTRSGDGPST